MGWFTPWVHMFNSCAQEILNMYKHNMDGSPLHPFDRACNVWHFILLQQPSMPTSTMYLLPSTSEYLTSYPTKIVVVSTMSNKHMSKWPNLLLLEFLDLACMLPKCLFAFPTILLFRSIFPFDKVLMPLIFVEVGGPMCKFFLHL